MAGPPIPGSATWAPEDWAVINEAAVKPKRGFRGDHHHLKRYAAAMLNHKFMRRCGRFVGRTPTERR